MSGSGAPAGRAPDQPHPSRLDPDHPLREEILEAHRRALAAGEPGYTDPATGNYVMTSAYLAARGTCCAQGCRHCPYVGEGPAVPTAGQQEADRESDGG